MLRMVSHSRFCFASYVRILFVCASCVVSSSVASACVRVVGGMRQWGKTTQKQKAKESEEPYQQQHARAHTQQHDGVWGVESCWVMWLVVGVVCAGVVCAGVVCVCRCVCSQLSVSSVVFLSFRVASPFPVAVRIWHCDRREKVSTKRNKTKHRTTNNTTTQQHNTKYKNNKNTKKGRKGTKQIRWSVWMCEN